MAILCAAMLPPAALMAWVLGGWRLMADLQWTSEFAIRDGVFSHWQVWVAIAIAVQFVAFVMTRFGRRDEDEFEQPAPPLKRSAQAGGH